MKKILMLGLAVLCGVGFAKEQKSVVTKPGAILEVYGGSYQDVRPAEDAVPLIVIVDKGQQFTHNNLRLNNETLRYLDQYNFKVWTGYVVFPEDGEYEIAMSYNYYDKWGVRGPNNANTILEISGRQILSIAQSQQSLGNLLDGQNSRNTLSASKRISLSKGAYEFKIIHRSSGKNDGFSLKFWFKKNRLKKTNITPATMRHKA